MCIRFTSELLLLALLLMSCREGETTPVSAPAPMVKPPPRPKGISPWPSLPRTSAQVKQLLKESTRRPLGAPTPRPAGPKEVIERLLTALPRGQVFAGWRQIVGRLEREAARARAESADFWLLWGGYHDAPLQIEAFRRVVAPIGLSTDGIVVEQFDASGYWRGFSASAQAGDDQSLEAYLSGGNLAALSELRVRQLRNNYTGWKYGYLSRVFDLLFQARATAITLSACDMPRALQRSLRGVASEEELLRLRELHCALSLRSFERADEPSTRAALWGQDHIGPDGFARFLSPHAHVVGLYVFGGRKSESALEKRLAARLALGAPVLIADSRPSAEPRHRDWLLLLSGEILGAKVTRSREAHEGAQARRLSLRAPRGSVLRVGARQLTLRASPEHLVLTSDEGVFALEERGRLLVGSLELAREGTLELELAPRRREMELRLRKNAE